MGRHIPSGASTSCSAACTQAPLPAQARKPSQGKFPAGKHSKAGSDIKRVPRAGGCTPAHSLPCRKGLSSHHIPNYLCQGSSQHVEGLGSEGYFQVSWKSLSQFCRSDPHSQELLRAFTARGVLPQHGSCAPGRSWYCFPQ